MVKFLATNFKWTYDVRMRTTQLFLILLVTLPLPAQAADPWTTQDTVLEGVYLGLLAIDCGQTIYAHRDESAVEDNRLLPKQPSQEYLRNLCAVMAISHPVAIYFIPAHSRTTFQFMSIMIETYAVWYNLQNLRFGLRVGF